MLNDYLRLSAEERQNTLLLVGRNQDLWQTRAICQELQAEGMLGRDASTVTGLRQKDLTTVQAAYVSAYEAGEQMIRLLECAMVRPLW